MNLPPPSVPSLMKTSGAKYEREERHPAKDAGDRDKAGSVDNRAGHGLVRRSFLPETATAQPPSRRGVVPAACRSACAERVPRPDSVAHRTADPLQAHPRDKGPVRQPSTGKAVPLVLNKRIGSVLHVRRWRRDLTRNTHIEHEFRRQQRTLHDGMAYRSRHRRDVHRRRESSTRPAAGWASPRCRRLRMISGRRRHRRRPHRDGRVPHRARRGLAPLPRYHHRHQRPARSEGRQRRARRHPRLSRRARDPTVRARRPLRPLPGRPGGARSPPPAVRGDPSGSTPRARSSSPSTSRRSTRSSTPFAGLTTCRPSRCA